MAISLKAIQSLVFVTVIAGAISLPRICASADRVYYICKTASGESSINDHGCGPNSTCKDARGDFTKEECARLDAKNMQIRSETLVNDKRKNENGTLEKKRETAWGKLCSVEGYEEIRFNISCRTDHEIAFGEMENLLKTLPSGELLTKVEVCALKWFNKPLDVIDAKMWRYCYYH